MIRINGKINLKSIKYLAGHFDKDFNYIYFDDQNAYYSNKHCMYVIYLYDLFITEDERIWLESLSGYKINISALKLLKGKEFTYRNGNFETDLFVIRPEKDESNFLGKIKKAYSDCVRLIYEDSNNTKTQFSTNNLGNIFNTFQFSGFDYKIGKTAIIIKIYSPTLKERITVLKTLCIKSYDNEEEDTG